MSKPLPVAAPICCSRIWLWTISGKKLPPHTRRELFLHSRFARLFLSVPVSSVLSGENAKRFRRKKRSKEMEQSGLYTVVPVPSVENALHFPPTEEEERSGGNPARRAGRPERSFFRRITAGAAARPGEPGWPAPAWPARTAPECCSWCKPSFPWPRPRRGQWTQRPGCSRSSRPGC